MHQVTASKIVSGCSLFLLYNFYNLLYNLSFFFFFDSYWTVSTKINCYDPKILFLRPIKFLRPTISSEKLDIRNLNHAQLFLHSFKDQITIMIKYIPSPKPQLIPPPDFLQHSWSSVSFKWTTYFDLVSQRKMLFSSTLQNKNVMVGGTGQDSVEKSRKSNCTLTNKVITWISLAAGISAGLKGSPLHHQRSFSSSNCTKLNNPGLEKEAP